jgi:hypothetical protein
VPVTKYGRLWRSHDRAAGLQSDADDATTQFLDLSEPPSAIVCAKDLRVISAMSEAIGRGVGDTALAADLQPALNTVCTAPVSVIPASTAPPRRPGARVPSKDRRRSAPIRDRTESR